MTEVVQGAPALKDRCVQKGRSLRAPGRLPDEVLERLDGLFPRAALEELVAEMDSQDIVGPGGLITQLAGRVVEAALAAELTAHLGYEHGQIPPGANERNGGTPKTLKTDLGPVRVSTPRDRDASFAPRLVAKRQTRLAGLDERISTCTRAA